MKNIRVILISVILISLLIWVLYKLNESTDLYIYGNSYRQNKIVNAIRLHKYGITGRNITVGILGSGFYSKHSAFKNTRIIKEYDFVTLKNTTLNFDHLKGLAHGTNVFSVIGGYKINEIIGIAYGANFLLTNSDISTDRLKQEEINAVTAARWLYENGAKIITTSLSFNKFDDANYYYPNQMDGKTAFITRTADSLVNKGVVFFSSAGNNFDQAWHIIEPPGDGFKVLAVGSIDKNLRHSFFSSCGLTTDGRIKPDLVAPGEGVWVANYLPKLLPEYGWTHGTSLAAPIAAGVAALILSAHPDLTSGQVIEAIKKTSSKSDNPDNLYGWGVPDAEKAVTYFGPAFSNLPDVGYNENKLEINTYVISSFGLVNSSVELHNIIDGKTGPLIKMLKSDEDYFSCSVDLNSDKKEVRFYFTAEDKRGIKTKFPSGNLGEYFVCRETNGKTSIVFPGHEQPND